MGDLSTHFSRHEFACKCGCGCNSVDYETLCVLEQVREYFGASVSISSAHRCASHNASIGGASNSQHLYGRACDIAVYAVSPQLVADYVENVPLKGRGGVGRYITFTHVDTRSDGPARWTG